MAKTAYKGTNSNLIAYKGDHEPIKIAVGGTVVDNLSYTEKTAEGTTSVAYQSEYKKNLLGMEIQGNSTQPSAVFDVSGATEYCGISSDIDSYYDPNSEWGGWTLSAVSFKPGALLDGETVGIGLFLPLPKTWKGEGVSFELVRKNEGELVSDIDLYLGNGVGIGAMATYDGLTPLLVDGEITSLTTDGATEYNYLVITDLKQDVGTDNPNSSGKVPGPADLKLFSHDYKLIVKKYVNSPSIDYPINITNAGDKGLDVNLCRYQEVEYIESTGTQYIDTGIIPTDSMGVDIVFSSGGTTGAQYIFGARYGSGNGTVAFSVGASASNNVWSVYLGGNAQHSTITRANNQKMHVVVTPRTTKRTMTFEDLTTGESSQLTSTTKITSYLNAYIFAYHANDAYQNSINLQKKMKLYSCKIYEGDKLERDFVPCINTLTNEAGLYDKVFDKFYTNAGTGAFTAGDITSRGFGSIASCTISTEVKLADNTVVPLSFAKVGDSADSLTIDTANGTVKYVKAIWQENISSYMFVNRTTDVAFTEGRMWFQATIDSVFVEGKGYCNILGATDSSYGDYDHFRVNQYQEKSLLGIITTGFNSLEEFNNWKSENTIIVSCALETPVEYNITGSDLANNLLEWAKKTFNGTNVIEVTSDTLPVSKLSVNYAKWGGTKK